MNDAPIDISEFRYPSAHELAVGIMVIPLLNWIVDADRVYTCCARLHLRLRPMNSVRELPRQMQSGLAPIQPEMIARRRHKHRAHAKIKPAGGCEITHAGIDEGQTGLAVRPSG